MKIIIFFYRGFGNKQKDSQTPGFVWGRAQKINIDNKTRFDYLQDIATRMAPLIERDVRSMVGSLKARIVPAATY
jgi:hypothetical protein